MSEPLAEMEVEDIEIFEALNNPLRLRILRHLIKPRSVRDLADVLDVPPTRLYYHINMLEEVGVIRVVETRKVGAMLQRLYQVTARSFKPSPKLVDGGHSPAELARITTATVLDGARIEAETALTRHFEAVIRGDKDVNAKGALGRTVGLFTPERVEAFREAIESLMESEFDPERDGEGIEYGFSYTFFPVAGRGTGERR